MKTIFKCMVLLVTINLQHTHAQNYNWQKITSETKHLAGAYVGLDYGFTYGIYYAKVLPVKKMIFIPGIEASLPIGSELVDDYKLKIGTAVKLVQVKRWVLSTSLFFLSRRNETPIVRMYNVGSELTFKLGYYREKWFLAAELGSDNALGTHLKHTDAYKGNYSAVVDGWYQTTGANLFFGLNTGLSLKKVDWLLSAGYITADRFRAKPTLPFYAKLGLNYRF